MVTPIGERPEASLTKKNYSFVGEPIPLVLPDILACLYIKVKTLAKAIY